MCELQFSHPQLLSPTNSKDVTAYNPDQATTSQRLNASCEFMNHDAIIWWQRTPGPALDGTPDMGRRPGSRRRRR